MSIGLLIFWGAVGWCGTPWPHRWPPPPPPDPWWFIDRIVGIIGGVIGGILFNQAWPMVETQGLVGLAVAASGVGALVGAFVLLDLYGLVRGRMKTPASQ
jgi:uncharacterized membrane protein YeaQ/YmgE (transglycosylase-associated protein family)